MKLPMPVDSMKYYTIAAATASAAASGAENLINLFAFKSCSLSFAFHQIQGVELRIRFRNVLSISTTLRYMNKLNGFVCENSLPLSATTIPHGVAWGAADSVASVETLNWKSNGCVEEHTQRCEILFLSVCCCKKINFSGGCNYPDVFHLHYIKLEGSYMEPSQSANKFRWVSRILMHSHKLNAFAFRVASKCKRHTILHGSWNRSVGIAGGLADKLQLLFYLWSQDILQALCSMFTPPNEWGQPYAEWAAESTHFHSFSEQRNSHEKHQLLWVWDTEPNSIND